MIDSEDVIQRLIESLQALAAPADVQGNVDALILDFDDAFLLIRDCPQIILTNRQQDALVDLDRTLTALGRSTELQPWTADVLRQRPEWEVVRRQAAVALDALSRAEPVG